MANFDPIIVSSHVWAALPVATEEHYLQVKGGPVLLTRHSAPTSDNGILLNSGDAIVVKVGDTWRYRMSGSVGAVIVRA